MVRVMVIILYYGCVLIIPKNYKLIMICKINTINIKTILAILMSQLMMMMLIKMIGIMVIYSCHITNIFHSISDSKFENIFN